MKDKIVENALICVQLPVISQDGNKVSEEQKTIIFFFLRETVFLSCASLFGSRLFWLVGSLATVWAPFRQTTAGWSPGGAL